MSLYQNVQVLWSVLVGTPELGFAVYAEFGDVDCITDAAVASPFAGAAGVFAADRIQETVVGDQ